MGLINKSRIRDVVELAVADEVSLKLRRSEFGSFEPSLEVGWA